MMIPTRLPFAALFLVGCESMVSIGMEVQVSADLVGAFDEAAPGLVAVAYDGIAISGAVVAPLCEPDRGELVTTRWDSNMGCLYESVAGVVVWAAAIPVEWDAAGFCAQSFDPEEEFYLGADFSWSDLASPEADDPQAEGHQPFSNDLLGCGGSVFFELQLD